MLLAFICTTLSGEEQKAAGMVPLFRGKKREGETEGGESHIESGGRCRWPQTHL